MADRARTVDEYWAGIYDQLETQRDDVALLRELISDFGQMRILEPFCGNGRIFIPLAEDGHEIVGMDRSGAMLDSGREKIAALPEEVKTRIVSSADWLTVAVPPRFERCR